MPVAKINSTEHPVKVGLSDAFIARVLSSASSFSGMNLIRLQLGDLRDLLGDPTDPRLSVCLSVCREETTDHLRVSPCGGGGFQGRQRVGLGLHPSAQ